MVHWVVIRGSGHPEVTNFLWRLVVMFGLLMAGTAVYVLQIPERWAPGRFDIWFHSHQVACVCVVWRLFVFFLKLPRVGWFRGFKPDIPPFKPDIPPGLFCFFLCAVVAPACGGDLCLALSDRRFILDVPQRESLRFGRRPWGQRRPAVAA